MSTIERPDMDLLELAYPYAMDAVTDSERGAIEQRRDRADRLTVAEFDATVSSIRETMAELSIVDSCPAPADLEDRLMRALDRVMVAALDRDDRRRIWGMGPFSRLDWLAAAVVLVVALGMGVGLMVFRTGAHPTGDVLSAAMIDQQPDMAIRFVPVSTGGQLEIHVSAALSAASVRFRAVPQPPDAHAYQVWLVPLGGTPRSAAVLSGSTGAPLVTPFRPVDTLAVTVEPAGGSPEPTTPPIASLNLIT